MADILIRGIEFPQCCGDCPLQASRWTGDFCSAGQFMIGIDFDYRDKHPKCPLVPLPEGHGRLVDADALRREHGLGKDCENCDRNTRDCNYDICLSRMDVCGWIDDAPTIVPAEGGTDNG